MNYLLRRLVGCIFICAAFSGGVKANNSTASAMAMDHNHKIVLVGVADNGTSNDFALARLNLDGSPDVTFNPTGNVTGVSSQVATDIAGNDDAITAIAIDANNKIVVAGTTVVNQSGVNSSLFGSTTEMAVARYNNDGSLDNTFNPIGQLPGGPGIAIISIGSFDNTALGIAIDSKGRIVVVGTAGNGTATDIAVVRLTPAGSLDTTFTCGIPLPPQTISGFGTTLITPGIAVVTPGIQTITINGNDVATCVAIGDADSIFVAGYTTTNSTGFTLSNPPSLATSVYTEIFLAKIDANGQLDQGFFNQAASPFPGVIVQSVNGIDDQINAIGIDVNRSLVLGGFTTINGPNMGVTNNEITNFLLVRYTQTGELFETIQTDINSSDSQINALTFDANNNIVVSGSYNTGTMNFNITTGANLAFVTARYTSDGSLDPTFNPGARFGDFFALPGIVITNVIPAPPDLYFNNNDNASTGVVTDAQNNIYVAGYSNSGTQTNFTTLGYLPTAALNTAGFNATGAALGIQAGPPGHVYNIFFGVVQPGNGVPLILARPADFSTQLLESLRADSLNYVIPVIFSEGPLITNDMQPTLNGIASPNAYVTLLVNDIPMTSVVADYQGNWSATLTPLLDGTYSVIALSTDPLTSINLASQPVSITISTEAPSAPVIDAPSKGETIRRSSILVQGKAKPETVVSIFIENRKVGEVDSQASGAWSFQTPPLLDGPQPVYAVATDKAGNVSIPSEIITFTIDTGKARAPRILTPKQTAVIRRSTVKVMGQGKPNSVINLFTNEKMVSAVKVSKEGRWTYALPVKEGDYEMYATAAKDKKLRSEIVKFTVDLTPLAERPKERIPGKGLFNGHAEPGTTITLILDGAEVAKIITDESGTWSYNPPPDHPIEKGNHLLRVSITDKTGKIRTLIDREVRV